MVGDGETFWFGREGKPSRWNNQDGTVGEWDVYRRVFDLLSVE